MNSVLFFLIWIGAIEPLDPPSKPAVEITLAVKHDDCHWPDPLRSFERAHDRLFKKNVKNELRQRWFAKEDDDAP